MNKKILKLFSLGLVFLLLLTGLIPSIQDLLFPKTMAVEPDNTITETTKTYNVNTYHFYDFPPNSSEDENFVNGPYGGTNGYTPYWRYSQEYVEEQEWTGGFTLEPYCFRATTTDGKEEVTYCLNLGKASPDGIDMNYTSEILSTQLNRVIKMGYPSKSGADYNTSDAELEWATAVALKIVEGTYYNYVKDESLPSPLTLEAFTNGILDKTFSRKYYAENQLTNAQIAYYDQKAEFALNLIQTLVGYATDEAIELDSIDMTSPGTTKAKENESYLVGPFNATLTSMDNATLQLKVEGISDYEIVDVNGNKLTTVDFGQDFYIKGTADIDRTIKVTAYAVELESPTRIGYTTTATKNNIPYQKMYVYETVTLQIEKSASVKVTTTIPFTKIWNDNRNEQGLRPESLSIRLFKNGQQEKSYSIDISKNPTAASIKVNFTGLDKYDKNGNKYIYTFKEVIQGILATNYKTPTYSSDSLTVTNTIKEKVNLTITKQWEDSFDALSLRPDSIKVNIYGTNTEGATSGGTLIQTVTLTDADISNNSTKQWIKTISFINDYDYFYVTEDAITLSNGYSYTPEIGTIQLVGDKTTVNDYTVTITNTLPTNYIEFEIIKYWEDERFESNRPNSITIAIYGTNNLTDAQNKTNGTKVKDITLTVDNENSDYIWSYYEGITVLDTYTYYYLVESLNDTNYTSTTEYTKLIKGIRPLNARAGSPIDSVYLTITNTHKYTEETNLEITKIWEDGDNQNSTRPTLIDIYLLQNGTRYRTITLNNNNALSSNINIWKINNVTVPKYDENGNVYTYTIEEKITTELANKYQSPTYNQTTLTVTNKLIPPVFHYKITVTKDIVNNNNQKANTNDFNKIKLNINDTYNFQIVLKEVSANYSYTGNIYNGVVTNKNSLVFSEIPAGRYEISENAVEYFKFVNFSRTNGTTGTSLEYLNGNYYIVISGTSNQDENIEIKVTNRIEDNRLYKDKNDEINLFLSSKKTETPI